MLDPDLSSGRARKIHRIISLCLVILIGPVLGSRAQSTSLTNYSLNNYNFIFDDFSYDTDTDYDVGDANDGGAPGSLYGKNSWLMGSPNSLAVVGPVRAWYTQNWLDQPGKRIDSDENEKYVVNTHTPGLLDNFLRLTAQGGKTIDSQRGVSSGFVAKEGIWIAKVRLSPLPTENGDRVTHAFWLMNPGHANFDNYQDSWYLNNDSRGFEKGWYEANFEIRSNRDACSNLSTFPECPINTGITWWSNTYRGMNQYLRPNSNSSEAKCRLSTVEGTDWSEGTDVPQSTCRDYITNDRNDVQEEIWTYLMIKITDTHIYQYIRAADGYGPKDIQNFDWLYMETGGMTVDVGGIEHFVPPHRMRALFTMPAHTNGNNLVEDVNMDVDWVYYTPDVNWGLYDLADDVSTIRQYLLDQYDQGNGVTNQADGAAVMCINTAGKRLSAPISDNGNWESDFEIKLAGPYTNSQTGDWHFETLPEAGNNNSKLRHTTYDIEWNITETLELEGTNKRFYNTFTQRKNGFKYIYPGPPNNYDLVKLSFDVTYVDRDQCPDYPAGNCNAIKTANFVRYGSAALKKDRIKKQIDVEETTSPFELKQNFPNPPQGETKVHFTLPDAGHVQLVVRDVLGREVIRIVDQFLSAGSHHVSFDATTLPDGVYFYTLRSNEHRATKSMIIY